MAVRYPRRFITTRRQLWLQTVLFAACMLPLLVSRFNSERGIVAMALGGLALAPLAMAYRGLQFLARQEQRHAEPTPEMTFVFMLMAVYPVAFSTFLVILLIEM